MESVESSKRILCPWEKCDAEYKRLLGEKGQKMSKRALKCLNGPPGPMTFSQIAVIINPYLGSALRGSTVPTAPSRFLSVFLLLLLFSISCTRYLLEEAEICPTYQREGKGRGSCWEAKSPPIQRMLITYVLSQPEPGLPL